MSVTPPPQTSSPAPSPAVQRWLASGWVAFLAAAAGLAPMVYLMDQLVAVTGGDERLPVPLGVYSLVFLSLWATALLACWLYMLLQGGVRRGPPGE